MISMFENAWRYLTAMGQINRLLQLQTKFTASCEEYIIPTCKIIRADIWVASWMIHYRTRWALLWCRFSRYLRFLFLTKITLLSSNHVPKHRISFSVLPDQTPVKSTQECIVYSWKAPQFKLSWRLPLLVSEAHQSRREIICTVQRRLRDTGDFYFWRSWLVIKFH